MVGHKVYWRGRIPIANVVWNYNPDSEIMLPENIESKRDEIWKKTIETQPSVYDGRCLVVDAFEVKENSIVLNLGFIRFSRIMVLESLGLSIDAYGSLGFQALIFSPDKKHLLFGTRANNLIYCPSYYSPIGGMLEEKDTEGTVDTACMREIEEEADVELDSTRYLVGIVSEAHGSVGIGLIIEGYSKVTPDLNIPVVGNDEWEKEVLHWYPTEFLDQIDETKCLDGLIYAKAEWRRYQETGESLFWP